MDGVEYWYKLVNIHISLVEYEQSFMAYHIFILIYIKINLNFWTGMEDHTMWTGMDGGPYHVHFTIH